MSFLIVLFLFFKIVKNKYKKVEKSKLTSKNERLKLIKKEDSENKIKLATLSCLHQVNAMYNPIANGYISCLIPAFIKM